VLVLLDTTVLIDYLRGAPTADRVEELLDRGDVACSTAINVEELARGLKGGEASQAHALIEGLTILRLGRVEGWQAGTWRREFAARGLTLSQADCLIAAAAWSAGAALATGNPKDFPMEEIEVEHWPVWRK
jgi:predicted nucleic acid-binding protein